MNILRVFNTVLLAAILGSLVLILLQIRQPIAVKEPVMVNGTHPLYSFAHPIKVEIDDSTPVRVEVER